MTPDAARLDEIESHVRRHPICRGPTHCPNYLEFGLTDAVAIARRFEARVRALEATIEGHRQFCGTVKAYEALEKERDALRAASVRLQAKAFKVYEEWLRLALPQKAIQLSNLIIALRKEALSAPAGADRTLGGERVAPGNADGPRKVGPDHPAKPDREPCDHNFPWREALGGGNVCLGCQQIVKPAPACPGAALWPSAYHCPACPSREGD